MSEVQRLLIQEGDETYEIYVEADTSTSLPELGTGGKRPGEKGGTKDLVDIEKAQKAIRGYALFVIGAFKNFAAVEVQEINIKFGLKFTGTAGIPLITQGSAEKNVEIEVKCKFPDRKNNSSTS
ncbi:CU044_2847 family protein [Microseira sp. BLCC-F43]|jgi:hypothetical protein|uniref:CU044_2847 family protein n=1 Tax=Microseira sp. BLCC-F43 TaxID=3153602 RepID=UPI0035B8C808